MNKIVIGLGDKTDALLSKPGFLLIDDGPIADVFIRKHKKIAVVFDPTKHSFNPLKEMNYRKARDLTQVFYGSEGKDTLTVRNGKRALTKILLKAEWLDKINAGKDDAEKKPPH